ncbi:MAG: RNA 2',3'-cyclic phosphodiesterase [Anaerolineales bacterium]|nr:RNA 2',3'-cyclic phosphodiesterase [Anaerolineales bacterium]
MRTFIALDLPDPAKQIVIVRQRELERVLHDQALAGCVRWTTRQNLHLTLRFLGDTTLAESKTVDAALAEIAAQHLPFELHLQAEGVFPNYRRPNIVWIDLSGDRRTLEALQGIHRGCCAGFRLRARGTTLQAPLDDRTHATFGSSGRYFTSWHSAPADECVESIQTIARRALFGERSAVHPKRFAAQWPSLYATQHSSLERLGRGEKINAETRS